MEAGGSNPISENLRKALDDLRGAGEKATGDVRSRIDSAVQRLNEASDDVTSRAQEGVSRASEQVGGLPGRASEQAGRATDQLSSWREALEKTTEDVRVQLAKVAVRAQGSLEGLSAIEEEIKKRAKELRASSSRS